MLTALSVLSDPAGSLGTTDGSPGAGGGSPAADYDRQLVFVALVGEPWGYMGSKTFLWELERRGVTVQGLDLALVDQVRWEHHSMLRCSMPTASALRRLFQ